MSCRCPNCHRRFQPRVQNKNQRYCNCHACQKARRNQWRRRKLAIDADYRANQRDAQARWLKKNPDYYRNYRKTHPDCIEKNRRMQGSRNRRQRSTQAKLCLLPMIAKSDAWISKRQSISGYYRVEAVNPVLIAKSDASIVKLTYISDG
ncbi:MAG: hypothetical protein R6W88_07470 [Desulfobacterales bacterium]